MKFGNEGFKRKGRIRSKGQLMECKVVAMLLVPIVVGFLFGFLAKQFHLYYQQQARPFLYNKYNYYNNNI